MLKFIVSTIPVYGKKESDWKERINKKTIGLPVDLKHVLKMKSGGEWKFNALIGYIEIGFDSYGRVGGVFYRRTGERLRPPYRTPFMQSGAIGVSTKPTNTTDEAIYDCFCKYIALCKKEDLSNYYVDDSDFLRVGKYIQWEAILSENFEKPSLEHDGFEFPDSLIDIVHQKCVKEDPTITKEFLIEFARSF